VIIVISILILGLSVLLLTNIVDMTKIINLEKTAPGYFETSVYPKEGKIGTSFKISFSVYNKTGIEFVTANILKSSNAIDSSNLYDDGNHGDEKKDDGIFSGSWDSGNNKEGSYDISFTANGPNEQRYQNATSFLIYKGNCLNLVNSGPSDDRINIVFLPVGYKSLEKFRNDILRHIDLNSRNNGLFSFEPFKSNKGRFNVYYVNETVNLGCSLDCEGIPSMMCCNDDKIVEAASQCPADQIIVLADKPQFCGSATFYAKICSYGISPMVMMHEFGHSFGGLGDEYNYEEVYPEYVKTINSYELNFPNCDKPGCEKWKNITDECWKGCSISALFRPTKSSCIMYTYVPEFDAVDIMHINSLLRNYGTSAADPQVLSRSAAPVGKSYFLNINYNNGIVTANNVYLAPGNFKTPDRKIDIETLTGRLVSFDNKVVENFTFEIPRVLWPPMSENGTQYSPIIKDKFNYTLTIPYSTEGKTFEAYDKGRNKVLSVDVGYLASTCGNNKCDPQENFLECPQDCRPGNYDNLCLAASDNVCDPDCKGKDPDCRNIINVIKENLTIMVLLSALVISLILLLTAKPSKSRR